LEQEVKTSMTCPRITAKWAGRTLKVPKPGTKNQATLSYHTLVGDAAVVAMLWAPPWKSRDVCTGDA
jgi:hypothetical protein